MSHFYIHSGNKITGSPNKNQNEFVVNDVISV